MPDCKLMEYNWLPINLVGKIPKFGKEGEWFVGQIPQTARSACSGLQVAVLWCLGIEHFFHLHTPGALDEEIRVIEFLGSVPLFCGQRITECFIRRIQF